MELINFGINDSGDYYLKGMANGRVEDMFYEPEDTLNKWWWVWIKHNILVRRSYVLHK